MLVPCSSCGTPIERDKNLPWVACKPCQKEKTRARDELRKVFNPTTLGEIAKKANEDQRKLYEQYKNSMDTV